MPPTPSPVVAASGEGLRIIDVSAHLDGQGPFWPGSCGLSVEYATDVRCGDAVTNSILRTDVHAGTHIDAPSHHLPGGLTVDQLDLADMIGPATVVEVPNDVEAVTSEVIEMLFGGDVPRRVLFKTRNSATPFHCEFDPGFVALTADGAQRLTAGGTRLVGMDYLSVQRFGDSDETHRILFAAGTIVLEGLNLRPARAGSYQMVCLPLRLVGAEAAPARVILMEVDE